MGERALFQLADRVGIEPDYVDEGGVRRVTPDAVMIDLLAAMGVDASTTVAAAEALDAWDRRHGNRPLDPVTVWRGEDRSRPMVSLRFGGPEGTVSVRWRLELEGGGLREGDVRISELPVTGRREGLSEYRLPLPDALPLGYHRLRVEAGEAVAEARLVGAPGSCHLPPTVARGPGVWGIAHQLYGLQSERSWGLGDFSDLRRLVAGAGALGAEAVGLNPVHGLFPANPAHCSPYSPSSRLFLNVAYIDVASVPEVAGCPAMAEAVSAPGFEARLEALRKTELVDYAVTVSTKLAILDRAFVYFRQSALGEDGTALTDRAIAFRRFQAAGGEALKRFALFDALGEQHGGVTDWRRWPAGFRDPASPEVAAFARERRDRVEFYQYLQWLADEQLSAAQQQAREAGMSIGLYHDLALGADAGGAEVWADQELYACDATIGAPPDAWNRHGQNWGLPPMNPHTVREQGYEPFARVLRALMRRGGALRIDHVMSLRRLFWIPAGADLNEGAYVRQPFDDLLGVLALESCRHRCLVVGEDLGTVPDGFRERMERESVLSYRLLYFERGPSGAIASPEEYPSSAAVVATTHDLPPLPGFWVDHDIEVREALALFPQVGMADEARAERAAFRRELIAALEREGLIDANSAAGEAQGARPPSDELVRAIQLYLARSRGRLLMVNLEDVLGVVEQTNMPGTIDAYPNWRRKLPLRLERILKDERLHRLAEALAAVRPGRSRRGRLG